MCTSMLGDTVDYLPLIEARQPPAGDFEEVFAFAIHKGGSVLMHKMIAEACQACAIPAFNVPDMLFKEGFLEEWQQDKQLTRFFSHGRVYYGFRNLPEFMAAPSFRLRERKAVLLVRDPRDALVSQYFSMGGQYASHALPDKNQEAFLNSLKSRAHLDIDAYVLRAAKDYLKKLSMYKAQLNFDRVLLRHYEDIYFDKECFLRDMFSHFALDVDDNVIRQVAAENDVRPVVEDPTQHIRKGAPGDHREKLRQDTIERLNDTFRDICQWYGYTLED